MNMKNLLLLFTVLLLGVSACSKSPTEPTEQSEVRDIQTWSGCFAEDTLADTYTIRTQQQYDDIVKPMNYCEQNMPAADFTKRTLLGLKIIEKGGFAPNLVETVFKNVTAKTYTYHIDIKPNDDLNNYITRIRWITIPKIEDDYALKFEVNYKATDVPVNDRNPFARKFWLSGEPYGMQKIVFKKGDPIYLNYSTKNVTKKTYRWTCDNDGPFGEFVIYGRTNYTMISNNNNRQWIPQNGEFKPGEEFKDSWRVGNEAELETGSWTAGGNAHWWFEGVPNFPWEIGFVIIEK